MDGYKYTESDFKSSVGKYGRNGTQCYNIPADQQMIQDLLNRIPEDYGGTGGKLKTPPLWGKVSDDLHKAIVHFQTFYADKGLLPADGHIDPHERTLKVLLHIAYDILFAYPGAGDGTYFPERNGETINVGGSGGKGSFLKLRKTQWRITGSSSGGGSLIVLAGSGGTFNLKSDYIEAKLAYGVLGGSLSPIPASISYGPSSMPQYGTYIWTVSSKDLGFQDLVGPLLILSGALAYHFGGTANVIWFNTPLGLGLVGRLASLTSQALEDALGRLNDSAGGVAFLTGPQWSSPDLSISLTTGLAWPSHDS